MEMTPTERAMTETQRILDGERCKKCGEYGPELGWDGCLWIECVCGNSAVVADFDCPEILNLWRQKNL